MCSWSVRSSGTRGSCIVLGVLCDVWFWIGPTSLCTNAAGYLGKWIILVHKNRHCSARKVIPVGHRSAWGSVHCQSMGAIQRVVHIDGETMAERVEVVWNQECSITEKELVEHVAVQKCWSLFTRVEVIVSRRAWSTYPACRLSARCRSAEKESRLSMSSICVVCMPSRLLTTLLS